MKPLKDRLADFGLAIEAESVSSGGSATVHKCRVADDRASPPSLGSFVAVKEYRDELLQIEGQLRRVRQEANVGARVDSENLVKTYGLLPDDDSPKFLVMEWIDGPTLEKWIEVNIEPSWDTLQRIARGIIAGVEALHSAGVLHRDLKPENVMLRADETPVVMDVGVAELTVESAETLHTEVGQFLGSMRYASPQHILGEKYDPSDDVYGLGAVLYELFTGKRMFGDHARKTILPIVVAQEGQRVDSLRRDIPGPIKVLLQACLHRDRRRRPSLTEVRAAIEDPLASDFITTELERQTAEERGYAVVQASKDGMSFFADLGSAEPYLEQEYTVVRRAPQIQVPSLGRVVTPEQWVGTAVLKHIFQNLGHFVLLGKRWQEKPSAFSKLAALSGPSGHWVEYEQLATSVKAGDWVLK